MLFGLETRRAHPPGLFCPGGHAGSSLYLVESKKISMALLVFITSFCLLRPEWTRPQEQGSAVGETIKAETNADWLSSSRFTMGQT